MANNQGVAERTAYTVDEALGPINAVAKLRDRETSRRWQAHYDLIRGRLLAMKVRCYEYNWACARMKKDPPKFSNPKSNAWRLVPDKAIQYSEKAAAAGREAETLLRRVVDEHPATPWALLAQRELKDPLGFKWVETYVPPRPAVTTTRRPSARTRTPTGQAAGSTQTIVDVDDVNVASRTDRRSVTWTSGSQCRASLRDGERSDMELRTPAPSSDDDIYRLAEHGTADRLPLSTAPGSRGEHCRRRRHRRRAAAGLTAQTMMSDPVVVGLDGSECGGHGFGDGARR